MSTFDYGTERWDLVAAIYIHGLLTVKAEAVVRSLKPGGILVVEGFHRDALPEAGYRTNELLTIFGCSDGRAVQEDVVGRRIQPGPIENPFDSSDWSHGKNPTSGGDEVVALADSIFALLAWFSGLPRRLRRRWPGHRKQAGRLRAKRGLSE